MEASCRLQVYPRSFKDANGDGYTAQVPSADIKADTAKTATATVTLSKAGKTGTVTDTENYTVDTKAPAKPEVTIGKNDDGKIINDEVDEDGNVTVTVGLPDDAKAGDTVVINGDNGIKKH